MCFYEVLNLFFQQEKCTQYLESQIGIFKINELVCLKRLF